MACDFVGRLAAGAALPPGTYAGPWQDPTDREQWVTAEITSGVLPGGWGGDVAGVTGPTDADILATVGTGNPVFDCDVELNAFSGPSVHWGALTGSGQLKERIDPILLMTDVASGDGVLLNDGVPLDWNSSPIYPTLSDGWPPGVVGFQYASATAEIPGPVSVVPVTSLVLGPASGDPRYVTAAVYHGVWTGQPAWTPSPVDPTDVIDDVATAVGYPYIADVTVGTFPVLTVGDITDLQPVAGHPEISGFTIRTLCRAAVDGLPSSPGTFGVDVSYGNLSVWVVMPQFRWIYCRGVPLRQFPRDDTLGGAPRQDRSSTSVQATQRQGWTGTYR